MKFCTKCGNRLNDDDLFCPRCGERQDTPIDAAGQEVRTSETPREETREEYSQEVRTAEVSEETASTPRRGGIKDFKAKDSIILVAGYTVAFIIYLILNATLFNEQAILGKIGFTFATGAILAIMIMRLVHVIHTKEKFLEFLQIVFVGLMGSYVISCLIILFNS